MSSDTPAGLAAVRAHVAANADAFVTELMEWLRIPSVGTDPAHDADVRASAEWLADRLRGAGFPVVELLETPGHPAVYAEWLARPGAPTVLLYGHHDVQPVDPLDEWTSPPFEPVVVDTEHGPRLLGRGAIDDKGQVAFHLLGLAAHLAATGADAPAVNLKVLVEGEEESGSPNFADLLRRHRERFACDTVVVSDTGIFDRDTPSICVGMRGMVKGELELRGSDVDLHSGQFGGAVPNPAHVLARLIAALHDDNGHVTIPGFYDGVAEPGPEERAMFERLPFDEEQFLADSTAHATSGEAGWSTLERLGLRPTAEINGLLSGYVGAGHKTIVPATAMAKFSFRLVPGQHRAQVAERFQAWLQERLPAGITSRVEFMGPGVKPFRTPLDDPHLQAVVRAMRAVFGTEVLFTLEGGSGPEADLAEILGVPLVFLGFGLPDDRIHAPNEKADIPLLLKGAEAAALLWSDLGGQA